MEIKNKFDLKEIVYLKTDEDQKEWLVCSIIVDHQGVMYGIRSSNINATVYDFELSSTRRY